MVQLVKPQAGKKADLMFVQHMLASLKDDGHMAIISLPQGLFYGTGIPACVLVCNKNKPDHLRGKVLFINADREFVEGKSRTSGPSANRQRRNWFIAGRTPLYR